MQALAKSIAWDGEGATCLVEVCILCYWYFILLNVQSINVKATFKFQYLINVFPPFYKVSMMNLRFG